MSENLSAKLRLKWSPLGSLALDANGRLKFPKASPGPGLYRFSIELPDGAKGIYFGESDNLARRFNHYRNPGPTQRTNIRMNKLLADCLVRLGLVSVSILTKDAWIDDREADLASRQIRRLFENFALSMHGDASVELHNL